VEDLEVLELSNKNKEGIIIIKLCEICGSNNIVWFNKKRDMFLCSKHRTQINTYDKILETTSYSKYQENEIIIKEIYAVVITRNKKYEINGEYIIDIEDIEKINNIRWRPDNKNYAHNNSDKNNILYMHRIIMNCPKDKEVDHINRNHYDNRKINLRIVNHSQNNINKSILINNTSGVTGVSWNKQHLKWRARININNKEKHLLLSNDFDKCVNARLNAEAQYFKEYSPNYNWTTKNIELEYYNPETKQINIIKIPVE